VGREQTYASLAQYLLEETYETFDAIQEADKTGDTTNLREELGDVLLQVVFHSTIAAEKAILRLMKSPKRRDGKTHSSSPARFRRSGTENRARRSEQLGRAEKSAAESVRAKSKSRKNSILEDVPVHFPALLEGLKLTKKAAKAKFDWENTSTRFLTN
jgi:uncharacterized protein YabN with tetrapyrrole methylase and pyrophosphatase domain